MRQAAEFLGPGGALADALPGFEHRAGQVEMAERVEETLRRGGALMVEAGTGTGKSFAYLVPALLSGERVVISTATRNLQDQLFEKDLPQLQAILGSRVPAARMKGRENYLCRLEWSRFQDDPEMQSVRGRAADIRRIARWAERTKTGDRDEIRGIRGQLDFWRRVSTVSENCIGRRCALHEECHLTTLRKRAHRARILIVNHHLLVADLIVRQTDYGEVLPDYDHLIVDEAHRLEDAATSGFSATLSSAAAGRLAVELVRFLKRVAPKQPPPPAMDALTRSWRRIFDCLDPGGDEVQRAFDPAELQSEVREHREAVSHQLDAVEERLHEVRDGAKSEASDDESGAERFLKRTAELRSELDALLEPRENYVHWSAVRRDGEAGKRGARGKGVFGDPGRTLFVSASPVHPGAELRTHLFGNLKSCVLTSATLAFGGGFGYAAEALGVIEPREAVVPSPFRFEDQGRLYVPKRLAPPKGEVFADAVAGQVLELVRASRGRALILFTSWTNLLRVGKTIERECPFPVLRQGRRGGHAALLDEFRKTEGAVLLGTRSFWEGVDVPGEALTLLVIDKLPFPAPSEPLHRARSERAAERTGNGFVNYSVPHAGLALKQGLGRLVRSRRDVGLACVLDSRIWTKSYGRALIEDLPPFPILTELEDAVAFLESLP